MGAVAGIITALAPVVTSIVQALTPAQQKQYHAAGNELEQIKKERMKAKADLDALRKEKKQLESGDINSFQKNQQKNLERQFAAVRKLPDPPKTKKHSFALMGDTSTGKTSTINKMYGLNEAVKAIRCTRGVKAVYDDDMLTIYDIFGANDEESYHNVQTLMVAKTLHKLCVTYTVVDKVLNMAKLVAAMRVTPVFWRNKCEDLSKEELQEVFAHDSRRLREATGLPSITLILGSAKTGMNIDRLKSALMPSNKTLMPSSKRRRTA